MPLPDGFKDWADKYFPKLKSQQSVVAEQMSLVADRMKDSIPFQKDEREGVSKDEWGDDGQDDEPKDKHKDRAEREFKTLDDNAKVTPKTFDKAYGLLKQQINGVVDYPDGYLSVAIKSEKKAVKDLHDQMLGEKSRGDMVAASQSLDKLRPVLKSAQKVLQPHDKEMRAYYKELKALQPRIDYAKAIHGKPDMGTKPWKNEAVAFNAKKGEVVVAQNARLFKDARARLGELKKLIDALMDKRLASLNAAKADSTTDGGKTKAYVDQLEEAEVSYLPSEEQVAMLETLRSRKAPLNKDQELRTRAKLLRNMKMDPVFEEQDKKHRSAVANKLLASPKFAEAEKNWNDWSKTPEGLRKQKAFLLEAAKLQCEVLGHPMPKINFKSERYCTKFSETAPVIAKHHSHNQPRSGCTTCNDVLPGSTTYRSGSPVAPPCNHCGNTDWALFGANEGGLSSPPDDAPGTQSTININTVPETSFVVFQEVLDSLIHENAHAYQMSLVYDRIGIPPLTDPGKAPKSKGKAYDEWQKKKKLWDNRLKPDDPDTYKKALYKQTMMFYENEKAYVGSVDSKAIDGDSKATYMKEPLEDHAWSFGPSVARQALVKRKKDLDSKQTLKEEFIDIENIRQTKPIVVKLKARHGLDKGAKVSVSRAEGMTEINGVPLSVSRVNSDVELYLDGDARTWGAYTKGGRLHVETKSDDLS